MTESNEPVAGAPSRPPRRTAYLLRIVFAAALVFTLIGLVEALFVGYDLATGAFAYVRSPDLGLGVRSWTIHHAMRPGYEQPTTHTNSFGLRSPEVAVPKPAGTYRILLLGDSFTFGFQAPDDEVFARRLEVKLRSVPEWSNTEVVNAGVLSYCPLLEFLQYRHQLHVLEADLVILNFDMSDVQDHLEYSRDLVRGADGRPLYVTEPSLKQNAGIFPELLSYRWLRQKINAAKRRYEARRDNIPFVRDVDRYIWALDGGPDMVDEARQTMEPIADLQRLLIHHDIPLVLATYPQPWQVSAQATPAGPIRDQYAIGQNTVHLNDRAFQKLGQFAADHGMAFVNATGAFRGAEDPAGLFLRTDFHFSARGNDLYAETLARYLIERGRK
ncbi:MAG TPA: SGNH/GDSL hydrolase family protein [Vicinamibacterales bacterium]|nr:SGNH/GDSL hydrolase family protein [Vicinamibacterales bacterium]